MTKRDDALFLAIGIDIPRDTLAVDRWRISPFPYVFADLMDRTCSALTILGLVGLKFHRFRLVRIVRGFLSITIFIATRGVRSGHICTEDCPDSFVNFLGCISLHLLGAVGIYVQSCFHAFVAYGAR